MASFTLVPARSALVSASGVSFAVRGGPCWALKAGAATASSAATKAARQRLRIRPSGYRAQKLRIEDWDIPNPRSLLLFGENDGVGGNRHLAVFVLRDLAGHRDLLGHELDELCIL